MRFREKLYKRNKVYSGTAVGFSADEIILPDGNKSVREYMEHPGAVCVLPFIDARNIILVKQYRFPVKELTFELPAGKLDKNENPLSCVKRELSEETGFVAKKVKKLCSYWPTPAFSDEIIHIYTANDLREHEKSPDEDEFIEHEIISFKKALKMVKNGKIRDSKTIIALLYKAALEK